MKFHSTILTATLLAVVLLLAGSCSRQGERSARKITDADTLIEAAHQSHNYEVLRQLVDSFQRAGSLSDIQANYWLGYVYSRKGQQRIAEIHWKNALNDEASDVVSLDYYARSASRLASLLLLKGDNEGTLTVALAAKKRMDEYHLDTLSEYSNLLATIGSCQLKLRNPEQAASTFEEVYQNYLQLLKKDRTGSLYKSAIVGMINTVKVYLDEHSFESAYSWTERFDSILTYYEAQPASDKDYVDKQRARLNIYRAAVLQEMGRDNDAAKAYQAALNTNYAQTADGYIEAIGYLMAAKRWNEAADNLECLDSQISRYGMSLSLDNIQKYYLPKFRANLGARRKDSVIAVGAQICNALDSAIYLARQDDAAELATIYDTQQKEAQIARQREEMTRIQMIAFMVASVLVVGFLFVYILNKRKASHRLKAAHAKLEEAHGQLKVAYDQLEDTTKAKERIESELRIARNIQATMVPSVFPNREGLDLFASMTPAREVGGDLYDYLLLDDQLYFCVGDVSGKGVPASLFMAQAIRLFRSIAKQRHTPATIATRINNELTEDNEEGMFVTMFIGLVNLKTGRLDYCNAGHNPPVLGVDGNDRFMEVESNAPIGLWPELEYVGEYVETIKGQMLLVYSDGLNEAENRQQQQFGDDHLLDILNRQHFHSSKALIDHLNAEVVRHRDGAEPNDDLTMLSLMIL